MMKKLSSLFLVVAMVLSLSVPVSAKTYTADGEDTITNDEGSDENALKVISGSVDVEDGAMSGTNAILQLATPVTFSANKKWAIEFELSGLSGEFAVLSAEENPSSYNIVYLPANGDLAPVVSNMWYRVTDSNHAVTANVSDIAALNNFDATARHIYRIENHGSDGCYYYLDGVKVGVYGQGAGGITNRSNGSDIARTLSSDFTVEYIGMKRWPLNATLYDLSLYTENSEIAFEGEGTLPDTITTVTPDGKDARQLYPTDKVTLPAPSAVPTGKVFVGWLDNENQLHKAGDLYTITTTGTTTLTASYAEAALAGTLMVVFNSDNTFSARLINANNADDLHYQWMRNGYNIEGATDATYIMTENDAGQQISCKATSTLQSGELTSQSMTVTSAANGTVQGSNIVMKLNDPIATPTDKNWAIEFKLSDITKEQQAILSDMSNEQDAANIRALYLYPTGDLAIIRNNVWYFTPEYTKSADFDAKAEHTYRIENRGGTVSYYLDGTRIGDYTVHAPGGVSGRNNGLDEGKPQLDVTYQYLGIERTADKNLYKFDGKLLSLKSFENNSTVAFNANYEGSDTISSIDSFGTGTAQRQLYVGDVITLPAAPTREGYDFGGWSDGNTTYGAETQYTVSATGTTTLTAQWTPTQYRISYELNGGTNADTNPNAYTIEDNDVTLVAPTREGYTFSGWTWEGQTEPTLDAVINKGSSGDKSFTANWTANTYTIRFVGGKGTEGGTADVPATYDQSVTLTPNGFTKADWKFLGWNEDPNATTVKYTDGQAVTNLAAENGAIVVLYAVWQEKSEFNPDLEVQHQTYDGHAKEFTLDGGYTIAYKQGTEIVSEPIEAGTYDVVITKAADDDHKAYSYTFEGGLIIDKADVTNTAKNNQHCIFGDTYDVSGLFEKDANAGEATYVLAENTDEGAGSAKLDGTILTITKAGTIKITMTTSATNNYNAGAAVTATLTVDKASPKVNISVDKASVVGGGAVKLTVSGVPEGGKVTVTQTDDRGSAAKTLDLTANGEISVRLSNTTAKYTFTVVYAGDDNYNGDNSSCEVSVTRRTSSAANPGNTISVPSTQNGTVTVSPSTASKGETVTITTKPSEGYELGSIEVLDKNGDSLKLKDLGNDKYSFVMPDGKVSVEAEFVKTAPTSFADVPANAYFADAVEWAVDKGITNGLTETMFGPYEPCTRAQIITFLWRAAGSPEPKTAVSFADVPAGSYYAKAVAWAIENGITNGLTETTFAPDATCTRGQGVTFLYRALKGSAGATSSFVDVPANAFYADAVGWAVSGKVTDGTSNSTFSPDDNCTRGQIVTFLYRAYQGK